MVSGDSVGLGWKACEQMKTRGQGFVSGTNRCRHRLEHASNTNTQGIGVVSADRSVAFTGLGCARKYRHGREFYPLRYNYSAYTQLFRDERIGIITS